MTPMTKARTDGVVIEGNTYDAHYKTGYYYSWNAATAGTGGSITSGNATNSICPTNWRLPYGSSDYNDTSGSFYYLLNKYGLVSRAISGSNSITRTPLYFVRGGRVASSGLYGAGNNGDYWSSTSSANGTDPFSLSVRVVGFLFAFDLGIYDTNVYSTNDYGNIRSQGYSVRCVVVR